MARVSGRGSGFDPDFNGPRRADLCLRHGLGAHCRGFDPFSALPGAALAFLIAGPATNAATIATTWKLLGRRTAAIYLMTIAISAVGCGLFLDWLFRFVQSTLPQLDHHVHQHEAMSGGFSTFWAVLLLLVIGFSYLRLPRKEAGIAVEGESESEESPSAASTATLERLEFTVSGMTCDHCAQTVTRALCQLPGVRSVEVRLKDARAVVAGEHLDAARLAAAVNALGYEMRLHGSSLN